MVNSWQYYVYQRIIIDEVGETINAGSLLHVVLSWSVDALVLPVQAPLLSVVLNLTLLPRKTPDDQYSGDHAKQDCSRE